MAVPKKRTSKSKRDMRRSHLALKEPDQLGICSNPDCRQPVHPHRVCADCGFYKGKQIVKTESK